MKNVLLRLSDLHNDVHAMYTSDTLCSGYRKRYCMDFGTNTKQTATNCSKAMLVIDQALPQAVHLRRLARSEFFDSSCDSVLLL